MADLVAALEVDKGPVSRACARLEEEGLLKRAADKSDARATLLTLTAAGKRKLTAARKKRHKVIEDLLKDWSPTQVKTFAAQVSKFNKLANRPERSVASGPVSVRRNGAGTDVVQERWPGPAGELRAPDSLHQASQPPARTGQAVTGRRGTGPVASTTTA